jgi:alkane 1-monooxygenase
VTTPSQALPTQQPQGSGRPWADAKRHLWLTSPGLPLLALLCLVAFALWGWAWTLWVLPALIFVLIPLGDWLVGADASNPPESAMQALEADPYYNRLVVLAVPLQWLVTVLGAWCLVQLPSSPALWLALTITVGVINGFGINTGHELGHKHRAAARWLAKLALAPAAYGHFFVEHNRGHHRHVATPQDPASARMGESFWRFLPRTMLGSLLSAWRLESARLRQAGHHPFHVSNHLLQAWGLTVLLFAGLVLWLGVVVLPWLLVQALYAITLLEVVNYLEHYGLLRQKDSAGGYERCSPEHSWNSNHVVGNILLYQLQRHSDHHANPARPYQMLRHFDNSPQLPSGYASMLLLAYVPPLWFAVMDKRVLAHYGGDIQRANVLPSARPHLAQRFSGPAS